MSHVKHTTTFLRSALVKDPFSLGDLIGPEDVLRIESEFPEFFKDKNNLTPRVSVPQPRQLKHTIPASGSPYKIPVISKVQPKVSAVPRQNIQKYPLRPLCSRGLRCLPQISIPSPEKLNPPLPRIPTKTGTKTQQTVPVRLRQHPSHQVSELSAASSSKKQPRVRFSVPSTGHGSITSTQVPVRHRLGHHVNDVSRSRPDFIIRPTRSCNDLQQPNIVVNGPMKVPSTIHTRSSAFHCQKSNFFDKVVSWRKSSEESCAAPSATTSKCSSVQSMATQKTAAPGFIRPVFSKKRRSRSRSLSTQSSKQAVSTFDHSKNRGITTYEEIFENDLHTVPEIINFEVMKAGKINNSKGINMQSHYELGSETEENDISFQSDEDKFLKTNGNGGPCDEMCHLKKSISGMEQLLFAKLLAENYKDTGKFEEKIYKKTLDSSSREALQLLQLQLNEEFQEPHYKISQEHRDILEKLAKELISAEILQFQSEQSNPHNDKIEVPVGNNTEREDEKTPKLMKLSETLETYREEIKEMMDACVGTSTTTSSNSKTHSEISLPKSAEIEPNKNKYPNDPIDSEIVSEIQSQNFANDAQEYESSFESETDTEDVGGIFVEVSEATDTTSKLSTISEEKVYLRDSLPRRSKSSQEAAVSFRTLMKQRGDGEKTLPDIIESLPPMQVVRVVPFDINNEATDCSSVSDFLFSENISLMKPEAIHDNLTKIEISNLASIKPDRNESISYRSKVEKFLTEQNLNCLEIPEGLQSLSLLRLSIPGSESTGISSEAVSLGPVFLSNKVVKVPSDASTKKSTKQKSILLSNSSYSNSTDSTNESLRQIFTNLLSHGEIVNEDKSVGEINGRLSSHSPGLRLDTVTTGESWDSMSETHTQRETNLHIIGESIIGEDESHFSNSTTVSSQE